MWPLCLLPTPLPTPPRATAIAYYVIGDVVIPGRMTLAVLNATDRTYLPTLGYYLVPPLQVAGLSIAGSSLYVTGRQPLQGDSGALWSMDIADPARPVARASLALPVHHWKLAREGPYLYASGEGTGLHVVEATAEGGLRERGIAPPGADSTEVAVGNGVAYVGDRYRTGLVAIDVSNPDAPQALPPTGIVDRFLALRLRGEFLYGAAIDSGFVTLDVRQPGRPRMARRDLRAQEPPYPSAIDTDGSLATVVMGNLRVLDVASVSGTRQVGAINEGGDSVALAGKLAYVVSNYSVAAVDLSQPEAPIFLATLPLPYEPRLGSSGRSDIAVLGDVVAVATGQGVGVLLLRFTPAVAPMKPYSRAAAAIARPTSRPPTDDAAGGLCRPAGRPIGPAGPVARGCGRRGGGRRRGARPAARRAGISITLLCRSGGAEFLRSVGAGPSRHQ